MSQDSVSTFHRSTATAPVTRTEIIDHIGGVFHGGDEVPSKSRILEQAQAAGCRPGVLAVLERLPDRRFARPQDLWTELPDIPID